MQIIQLIISIVYEKENSEGKLLTHTQQISVNFSSKRIMIRKLSKII